MGRIPDKDRLPVVDGYIGHWNGTETVARGPVVVIFDDIDEVVLRNGQNEDFARGVYDPELPDPGP